MSELAVIPPNVGGGLTSALEALSEAAELTEVSFNLADPEVSYDAWLRLGEAFCRVRKASSWWIGDWYIFGGRVYGEDKAAAAEQITGLGAHTLATIVRTCMYVPRGRRNLSLPFSYHTEVSRLMPEEQERFLNMAEQYGWTREQLRESIRVSQRRFKESQPVWEGAIAMKRQQDVEEIAREVLVRAQPDGDYYKIERELMVRLSETLGEELAA